MLTPASWQALPATRESKPQLSHLLKHLHGDGNNVHGILPCTPSTLICVVSRTSFSGDKWAINNVLICIIFSCNYSFISKHLLCDHHECKRYSVQIYKPRCLILFSNVFRRLEFMFPCLILTTSNHSSHKNIYQFMTWKMLSISLVFHF